MEDVIAVRPASEGKVFILGNCQSLYLTEALVKLDATKADIYQCRQLASPLTYLSHPGEIPQDLQEAFTRPDDRLFLATRPLENQFEVIGINEPTPRAIILTLFHEADPIYEHRTEKYMFHVPRGILRRRPEIGKWIEAHFTLIKPDPKSYLDRFFRMVGALRKRFPETPVLVLKRATNLLAYSPAPFSYLNKWRKLVSEFDSRMAQFPDIATLEMDRIVGGLMREQSLTPNQIFPFIKPRSLRWHHKCLKHVLYFGTPIERDIEHAAPFVWDRLAAHLKDWIQTGFISYRDSERPPHACSLVQQYMKSLQMRTDQLSTGDPYIWACVFESMILHPKRFGWERLGKYVEYYPVNDFLFRCLRTALSLHPSRAALPFLEAHYQLVKQTKPASYDLNVYLEMLQKCIDQCNGAGS